MDNLYRGTTPTIILRITNEDFDMNDIDVCHVTIETDCGKNQKIFEDPTIDIEAKTISVTLTQQETLSYKYGKICIQAKMKLKSGTVIASKIITTTMNRSLEEQIL